MSHQPFEKWIIAGEHLPPDDQNRLKEHLADCPQCRQLKCNLQAVHTRLTASSQIEPVEGFSQRWQTTLQERLAEQHTKQVLQVRRFFLYIGTATILSLLLLITMILAGGEWIDRLTATAIRLQTFNQWTIEAQDFLFAVLHITPPVLPLTLWILLSTVFSILALVWIVSVWRITIQGVKSK